MAFIDPASGIFRIGDQLFEFEGGSQQAANLRVISPQDIQNRFMTTAVTAGMTPQQFVQQEPDITTNPEAARRAGIGDVNAGYSSIDDILQAANKASPSTELARATQDYKNAEAKGSVGGSTTNGTGGSGGSSSPGIAGSPGGTGVGYTRDKNGNVFDAQGNHVTYESLPKDAKGNPIMNLTTLPLGSYTLDGAGKTTQSGVTQPSDADITAKLKGLGLSDEQISQLSPQDKNTYASIGAIIQSKIDQNNPLPQLFTAADLDRFMKEAQNDPNIDKYYKDQLAIGSKDFLNNVAQLQGDTQFQQQQQQQAFKQQSEDLSNAAASAGRAYSGYRARAEQELGGQQKGIVESTRRQLQSQLQSQAGQFEKTYGSDALKNLGIPSLNGGLTGQVSYDPYGGIGGSQEQQRLLDIRALEQQKEKTAAQARGITT